MPEHNPAHHETPDLAELRRLTAAEARIVARTLRHTTALPGRCSCGADAYCSNYLTNGYHKGNWGPHT